MFYLSSLFLLCERIPALSLQCHLTVAIASNHCATETFGCDMTNEADAWNLLDHLILFERHGEEQFVVLTSIHCHGRYIEIEFFGLNGCLIVDRDTLLIDTAAYLALCTDMEESQCSRMPLCQRP